MMTNWAPRRGAERDLERRSRQIKEMVRLGSALRAEMGLASIFSQVVEAINTTIGFNVAALNLVREHSDYVAVVATAGLDPADRERLTRNPPRLERLLAALRPEFCISHSYFISHHHKALLDSISGITLPAATATSNAPDAWHPSDMLLVPLISPRDERLLGILSLDQPEDGKIPSLETIEVIELFANQAALAIDTSRLFQEREQERQTLRDGLFDLLFQLEQIRQGNLGVRPQLNGNDLLDPITQSLNATLVTLNSVLTEVRGASDMVNLNATEMRAAAVRLAESAQQQAEQMLGVSQAMETMAGSVRWIAETANTSSAAAQETSEISHEGRDAAERAAEGMSRVREMTLQAAKKVKRLGESSQEIGAIVQMVADFTNQTNLLALNAAIEAARAGEHGRGFAIVAQEIRNLATGSAEATRQIHARIQSVQNETSQVVSQIEHTTQQVVLQSEFAAQAGAALEAADAATQRIAEAIDQMRVIATQQAQTATQLAQAVTSLSGGAIQTRDSMEQTRASMDYLVELANSLLRKVGMFHLGSEAPAAPLLLNPGAHPGAPQWPYPATMNPATMNPATMNPATMNPATMNPATMNTITSQDHRSGPLRQPTGPMASYRTPPPPPSPSAPSAPRNMPPMAAPSSSALRRPPSNRSSVGGNAADLTDLAAPFRPPMSSAARPGSFAGPSQSEANGPQTDWLRARSPQVGPGDAQLAPPAEITGVVPIVGVPPADAWRPAGDAAPVGQPNVGPGFSQGTVYPTPAPLASFDPAHDPALDPLFGAAEVVIPLGPALTATGQPMTPADARPQASATPTAPALPPIGAVPDSGMIKGPAGAVNLNALSELTTLEEIELLATQPMASILQSSASQPGATPAGMPAEAPELGSELAAPAAQVADDAPAPTSKAPPTEAGQATTADPETAVMMAVAPTPNTPLRGLPYDTTPLPQMTAPLPIASLEAFLRGGDATPQRGDDGE